MANRSVAGNDPADLHWLLLGLAGLCERWIGALEIGSPPALPDNRGPQLDAALGLVSLCRTLQAASSGPFDVGKRDHEPKSLPSDPSGKLLR